MASGQLVLAFTESLPTAVAARAVVGLGDAVTFISVLRLVPYWFSPTRPPADPADRHLRATRPGAVGHPLPRATRRAGWATAYVSVAAIGVLAMVLALALVKNTPEAGSYRHETTSIRETLVSVKTVWLRPGTRLGFFTHMGTQFSVTVFALMWGVPYLTEAQGHSTGAAGAC